MQQMKYSDNVWIGNIPNNWSIKRFKHCINLYTGNSISDNQKDDFDDSDNANPYIASKDINRLFSRINYENGMYVKKNDYRFKFAHKGDSLLCIEGGSAGKKKAFLDRDVAFVNKLCCLHSKCFVNKKFLYYFILSPSFEEEFIYNISGLIGGVSVSKLNEFKICFPELQKQKIIVDFLDKKCGEIDGLIADIEKEIEILIQYRKSIITETVTKGLNKDIKLKDSGIEWAKQIPEHWEIIRIKDGFIRNKGKAFDKDPTILMLARNGVKVRDISGNKGQIAESYYEYNPVHINDLLLNPMDLQSGDNCSISNIEGVISPAYINLKTKNDLFAKYYHYLFKTMYWIKLFFSYGKGVSFENRWTLSFETLQNIKVFLPPIQEQREIADYLDKKCKEIDSILEDKNKQLETLESYKKSIIYEYVTGKKEVK